MVVDVRDMVRKVRKRLDQNHEDRGLIGEDDEETLRLEELIEGELEGASRTIVSVCEASLLDGGKPFGRSINWSERAGSGRVLLPEDFLRLIVFRMSDWKRGVYAAEGSEDSGYALSVSPWGGVSGSVWKPRVVITSYPGGRILEFHGSADSEATIAIARYAPYPRREGRGIELPGKIVEAVVSETASRVLLALGETEQGSVMHQQALEMSGAANRNR